MAKKKVTKKKSVSKKGINHDLLFDLLNTVGVSGHEHLIREKIKKYIKPYVDEIKVDKFGNLICREKGPIKKPTVMISAHMDEVGLMVKRVHKMGRLEITPLGGLDPLYLVGQPVAIDLGKNGLIRGFISTKELTQGIEADSIPKMEDLFVDTGLTKKQLGELGVGIGTYLTFEPNASYLGSDKIIGSKAVDDRVGCYILLELAKRLRKSKHQVMYVFTVQEEIGLFGARTSAYNIRPDWGIALDVADAEDYSDVDPGVIMGDGPVITVRDSELVSNTTINKWIENIGKKLKINIQKSVSNLGTTDATNISLSRGGVPSTVMGVAVRNMHSAVGIVNTHDIEDCIDVLYELFKNPPNEKLEN